MSRGPATRQGQRHREAPDTTTTNSAPDPRKIQEREIT